MSKGTIIALVICCLVLVLATVLRPANQSEVITSSSDEVIQQVEQKEAKQLCKAVNTNRKSDTFDFETDLFEITFDTKGGSVESLKMKEHSENDEYVDIIFKGENDNNAFLLYWGDELSTPVEDVFDYSVSDDKVVFTNDYVTEDGKPFTVIKTFEFKDGEYLFALNVEVKSDSPLGFGDYDYSIGYEPQVGPSFKVLKNSNYDYRRIYADVYKSNGKLKKSPISYQNGEFFTVKNMKWFSLTGKYFTVTALPENSQNVNYKYTAFQSSTDEVYQTNSFFVSIPASDGSEDTTVYYYCGPQLKKYLGSYYSGTDNAWGLRNTELDDVMEGGSALGWLETLLKWCLQLIYFVIPNYGICIIILTIILKFAMWPLTKKSTESTAKTAKLQPMVQEIQKKYPNNPQKQNAEMQALYKQYGVSPLGGCLPLLIQFPILIAFYGLLNKHFELRGAMFIPGWIPDLSIPDQVATLGFNIPLLGNEIHLLPLIYTVSMILSMQMSQTQQQSGQQQASMKFMTWGMPIIFFFILFSAPSGLFVYWTSQNILSIIQQIITNKKVNSIDLKPVENKEAAKEPEAIRKYKERLAKLEEAKALAEKQSKKNNKKADK